MAAEISERKRKSTGFDDAAAAPVAVVNPWTGKGYSQQYYAILDKRQGLPVWEHRKAFLELVERHQVGQRHPIGQAWWAVA